jgi:transposase
MSIRNGTSRSAFFKTNLERGGERMGAICGIDWASEWHDVRISDGDGGLLIERRFAHDERGLEALTEQLLAHRVARVAIERPDGLLVGRLISAGICVLAIHPNQVSAARERFRAAAGKSDRFDAFVLCELARTDAHRFPALAASGDETIALKLRSAPAGSCGELEGEARRSAVSGLVAALRPIVEQISQLTSQIAGAVRQHPDGEIFLSFFRDAKSVITAAGLLAEIGDNRARYPTEDALAADAGQAPVAKESGKRRHASFRWACDKRLRNHFGTLADSTRHWHPWANDVYTRASARGQDHPHACRTLGRAWTRVLWRCWQDRTPYDPARHGNLTRLLEGGG